MNKFKFFKRTKGQSTLEYLIVLAVVIAIIVVVVTGKFRQSMEGAMNKLSDKIQNAADEF